MSSSYAALKAEHATLDSFVPPIPTALLPYIAFITLLGFFILAFMFTTLPRSKSPVLEIGTAALASILAGAGVVAAFCAVGVYV